MTKTELQALSLKQLAAVYNQHADKPIKAFSGSKDTAVERVLAVLPKAAMKAGAKPRVGSGAFIRECLTKGKLTPAEIIEQVHAKFPTSRATTKDVAWHKNRMKEAGEL